MARQTECFVQAFDAGKGGHVRPDSPIACKSASGALRTAERLALSKLAVVAYSSTGDPEMVTMTTSLRSSSGRASFRQRSTETTIAGLDTEPKEPR
jgi:hypothetical protein